MVSVLIADDQALQRQGFFALLKRAKNIEVLGEARDGREAVELTEQLKPDVVCMDIKMPHLDGLRATAEIHRRDQNARVLVVAMTVSEEYVRAAVRNGARGYVAKADIFGELIPAIRTVFDGSTYYSASVSRLIDEMTHHGGLDRDCRGLG